MVYDKLCPSSTPPLTCINSSHSWLAEGPFKMSDNAVAHLEAESVGPTPRLFVSCVKTVHRNCRATVWRSGSVEVSVTHTDNVPADKQGVKQHGGTVAFYIQRGKM